MFAVCDGVFDESTGTYQQNTITEQQKCCLDLCKPINKYCRSQCNDKVDELFSKEITNGELTMNQALDRCNHLCAESHSICTHTCKLLSPEFQHGNSYHKCATVECPVGRNLNPSGECVSRHRSSIKACCMEKTGDDEYCNFQQEMAVDRKNGIMSATEGATETVLGGVDDKSGLIVIMAIVFAIVVLLLLWKSLIFGSVVGVLAVIILLKIK